MFAGECPYEIQDDEFSSGSCFSFPDSDLRSGQQGREAGKDSESG
jgi:hypothetical protein